MPPWTQTLCAQFKRHVRPQALDWACEVRRLDVQRECVVLLARGEALAVGIASVLNQPQDTQQQVSRITSLDRASAHPRKASQLDHDIPQLICCSGCERLDTQASVIHDLRPLRQLPRSSARRGRWPPRPVPVQAKPTCHLPTLRQPSQDIP